MIAMKKYCILFCLMLLNVLAMADNKKRDAQIMSFDKPEEAYFQMARMALANNDSKAMREAAQNAIDAMVKSEYNTDSLQAEAYLLLGFGYGIEQNTDKAVEAIEKGREIYRRSHEEGSNLEACLYMECAHFLNLDERTPEAANYIEKAAKIYLKNMPNSIDMAKAMMLAAEISYEQKKYEDAVSYERLSLRLYESNLGKHHKDYIEECSYMATYLKAVNQNEEAEKYLAEAERLTKEAKTGYIPQPVEFTSAEQCHLYNEDAKYAALYFLTHPMDADSMVFVSNYLEDFGIVSEDVYVIFGTPEEAWLKDGGETASWLQIAYTAGFILHQLNRHEDIPSLETYQRANKLLLQFYSDNDQFLKSSKTLDNYIKLFNKKREKYDKLIEDQYETARKDFEATLKMAVGLESDIISEHPIVEGIFGGPTPSLP